MGDCSWAVYLGTGGTQYINGILTSSTHAGQLDGSRFTVPRDQTCSTIRPYEVSVWSHTSIASRELDMMTRDNGRPEKLSSFLREDLRTYEVREVSA